MSAPGAIRPTEASPNAGRQSTLRPIRLELTFALSVGRVSDTQTFTMIELQRLMRALERARGDLLARRTPDGHWEGRLASSSLATATALSAFSMWRMVQESRAADQGPGSDRPLGGEKGEHGCSPFEDRPLIEAGLHYLLGQQRSDGGWGDTDKSDSNIATTMLVQAAVELAIGPELARPAVWRPALELAERYVEQQGGIDGLRNRYGKDKTFAVPILTNAALAGLVDWPDVAALPFELACVPQSWFRWVRMPVVSYAIPALVAIGQARFAHRPPRLLPLRWLRRAAIGRSLRLLRKMQPDSGGYLEAVPLTSFVVMSLSASVRTLGRNLASDQVLAAGLDFLRRSVRRDGSWPIDTNLATWLTSLSTSALAAGQIPRSTTGQVPTASGNTLSSDPPEPEEVESDHSGLPGGHSWEAPYRQLPWLIGCQHRRTHPFTGAQPGGWGWTDLSGAVPDADDTAAALLALSDAHQAEQTSELSARQFDGAVRAGVDWLLDLQNRDGGWPTFCRGWGRLPFDRSGSDLTAHAMRALSRWGSAHGGRRVERALRRGWRYLDRTQRADGSWLPLWFGNQDHPAEENPVYGTARVLLAYFQLGRGETRAAQRGCQWLESVQNADGGWNGSGRRGRDTSDTEGGLGRCGQTVVRGRVAGASSVEETALALETLLSVDRSAIERASVDRGLTWLCRAVADNRHPETAPIGFYFAKLWYYENLYPLTFTVAALGLAVRQRTAHRSASTTNS